MISNSPNTTHAKECENGRSLHTGSNDGYGDGSKHDDWMAMVGIEEDDVTGNKTATITFRCRPEALRLAMDADSAKTGQPVTEIILRTMCDKYGIQFVAATTGRPAAKKAAKKKAKP